MRHPKSKSSEPSQRQRRVGEQIRHILSETLQRGHFDNVLLMNKSNTIIVSEVRPSPDLKHARAYVMSLNGEDMEELLEALNDQSWLFQKEIAREISMKFTPRVKFFIDNSFDEAQHIEDLLRDVLIPEDDEPIESSE